MIIRNITPIVFIICFLLYSCKTEKSQTDNKIDPGEEFSRTQEHFEYLYSSDSLAYAKHKIGVDTIKLFFKKELVNKFDFTYVSDSFFSRYQIITETVENEWKNVDLLYRDSVVFLPLNDVSGRSILRGYNLKTRNTIFVNGKDINLVSSKKIFFNLQNNILVTQSRKIDSVNLAVYEIMNDNYLRIKNARVHVEELSDSVLINTF